MITEDYVSFETAKLLKEKGFDIPCDNYYDSSGKTPKEGIYGGAYIEILDYNADPFVNSGFPKFKTFSAPTQAMAMKWLREVHKLNVEILPNPLNFEHQDIQDGWGCEVRHLSDLSYDGDYEFFQKKHSTYEEACEAAIKYCLENLIKEDGK